MQRSAIFISAIACTVCLFARAEEEIDDTGVKPEDFKVNVVYPLALNDVANLPVKKPGPGDHRKTAAP
jgi:hypothetical protein